MNYIDELATSIGERSGMGMADAEERRLLRHYAVLCRVKGEATTNEDVHDAWAAWRAQTKPDHDALVPFAELDLKTQELDSPYRDAIRWTAQSMA